MRSTWLTLGLLVSLELFGSPTAARSADLPGDDSAAAKIADTPSRQRAQELLRQATAELNLNHFAAARRLALQAAEIDAPYGLFDARPEHVLAAIDRKEHSFAVVETPGARSDAAAPQTPAAVKAAAGATPARPDAQVQGKPAATVPVASVPAATATAASSRHSALVANVGDAKSRAIELLDKGLLALDQKRFDDAERFAHQAAALSVKWARYDYRPENLLDEVRAQRGASILGAETPSVAAPAPYPDPISDPFAVPPARDSAAASSASATAPHSPALSTPSVRSTENPAATTEAESEWPPPLAPVKAPTPAPVVTVPPAYRSAALAADRTAPDKTVQAEVLLQQALGDLRQGHNEVAKRRIEGALGLMQAPAQHAAAPRTSSLPRPPAASTLYGAYDATDPVLKPVHDPFLGDDLAPVPKRSAAEASPRTAKADPVYQSKRPTPVKQAETIRQASYEAPASPATPTAVSSVAPRVPVKTDGPPLSPQMGWLEQTSAPITNSARPSFHSPTPSALPYRSTSNPAPVAPPDGRWTSAGRASVASSSNPPLDTSNVAEKPGLLRRMWSAIKGE